MDSKTIYNLMIEKCPNHSRNIHYLNRYVNFIFACIEKNKDLPEDYYTERHHILPRSMWPELSDFKENEWNCSVLTARQHLIAHLILARSFGGRMWSAFVLMTGRNPNCSLKLIAEARAKFSSHLKEFFKTEEGKKLIRKRADSLKLAYKTNPDLSRNNSIRMSDYQNSIDEETGLKIAVLNGIKASKTKCEDICEETGLNLASRANLLRAENLRSVVYNDNQTELNIIAQRSADTRNNTFIDGICQQELVNKKISESKYVIDDESGKTIGKIAGDKISKIRIERGIAKGENNPMFGKESPNRNRDWIQKPSGEFTLVDKDKYEDFIDAGWIRNHPNKGKQVIQPTSTCFYCGKEATNANIQRWHNDNCKHKDEIHTLF